MRSIFASILKAFGVILIYGAWIGWLYAFLMTESMAPLMETLGKDATIPQRLVSYTIPLGSFAFGCVLIFLAHPLSCLMFRKDEGLQAGVIISGDLMLLGICVSSYWFLITVVPSLIEEIANASKAGSIDKALPGLVARGLQILSIVLVLAFRRRLSKWLGGPAVGPA